MELLKKQNADPKPYPFYYTALKDVCVRVYVTNDF